MAAPDHSGKAEEDALLRSERRLRAAQAVAHVGSWEFDLKARIIWGSDEAFRIYGLDLTPDRILPWALVQAVPLPEYRPILDRAMVDLLSDTRPYDVRFRIRRHLDGAVRIIQSYAEVERDAAGLPWVVHGTIHDITESEEQAQALLAAVRASEERARRAFEQAADAILIFDGAGTLLDVNARALDLTGRTRAGLVGRPLAGLFSAEVLARTPLKYDRVLEGETVLSDRSLTRADGQEVPVEMRSSLLSDGTILSIVRDVSERRQLEAQLQLRQRMDSLGTLASGIAHDFNNILAAIMGYADLLRVEDQGLGPAQREAVDAILQSSRRAADLVHGLQHLTRAEQAGAERYELAAVVGEVVNVLRETTDRLVAKVVDVQAGSFAVRGSASGLYHALMNLGLNAVQAIEERGARPTDEVRFSAEGYLAGPDDRYGLRPGAWVRLSVRDTGVGMTDEVRRRAFDPLFTTKAKGARKGQGLGLTMVFNAVTTQHGGAVDVESAPGQGTTFHLFLPRADAPDARPGPTSAPARASGWTVLVVDDEPLLVAVTRRTLERAGHTVLSAMDGVEAVELFERRRDEIDLVLLDRTLPRLRGEQVLRRLRALKPEVRVVVSSGDAITSETEFPGVAGVLLKPYTPTELTRVVRELATSKAEAR